VASDDSIDAEVQGLGFVQLENVRHQHDEATFNLQLNIGRHCFFHWGRFRKRKKSYAKRALMPPRRGIGRTHGKRCLKVCNAASLSVFSDEQHGFFGVDFVMRNVQLEVLRIHQRL